MATSYIWRDHAVRASATAANTIEFEASSVTDDQGHIHQSEFKIVTAIADNEKPNAQLNELQDTQVDTITVTLTGSIHNFLVISPFSWQYSITRELGIEHKK